MLILLLLLFGCGPKNIAPEVFGKWEAEIQKVTVRSKDSAGKFVFTTGSATAFLEINEDKTVTGKIGNASFKNGLIKTNWGLPTSVTGVSYIIKCDLKGKIFNDDPLEQKEVAFWLAPLGETLNADLRYTTGMAHFPMSEFNFEQKQP